MIFTFLTIFENGHIAIDWLYFDEFNSKQIGEFCYVGAMRTLVKIFIFKKIKITGTLKMNFFFCSHEPSSYIKDQLPKIEFKIRGCLVFFLFFKIANFFDLKNSRHFFEFLIIFSFKKNKEQILFQVKPLNISNTIFFADFRPFFGDFRGF